MLESVMDSIHKRKKIVLTGGPGGGKTTVADLFKREYLRELSVVQESATILFKGGFPRTRDLDVRKEIQRTIYQVQVNQEKIHDILYPNRTMLCDRGTVDGAAYWPDPSEDFFRMMNTTLDAELARYDAVIFFETAAARGFPDDLTNYLRIENPAQAIELDTKLRNIWSQHEKFILIKNDQSFLTKIHQAVQLLNQLLWKS